MHNHRGLHLVGWDWPAAVSPWFNPRTGDVWSSKQKGFEVKSSLGIVLHWTHFCLKATCDE